LRLVRSEPATGSGSTARVLRLCSLFRPSPRISAPIDIFLIVWSIATHREHRTWHNLLSGRLSNDNFVDIKAYLSYPVHYVVTLWTKLQNLESLIRKTLLDSMQIFGYARASATQQSLDTQINTLKTEGIEADRIFTDGVTIGHAHREGLRQLQGQIRQGDTVFVTKVDRLGRSIAELIQLITAFDQMGVTVRFLDDGISTEGSMGKVIVAVLSAVAQAERQLIQERTSEGRLEAKEKGVKFGRKPTVDRERVQTLRVQGVGAADIARQMNVGRSTVYKILQSLSKSEQRP
jgi:DNA invertase Pin-like site-specific DNA recombinase